MSKSNNNIVLLIFMLVVILLLTLIAFAQFTSIGSGPASSLIWLLIVTQFLVIGVLIVGAIIYSLFNKTDNKHALGLPPGSIRAFIALVLISSFLVVSVFMFDTLNSQGEVQSTSGLNSVEKENLLNQLPPESIIGVSDMTEYEVWYHINDSTTRHNRGLFSAQLDSLTNAYRVDSSKVVRESYVVEYTRELDESASDLAKQILTILSTLVVAVSAFYFGSKATEQGGKIAREVFQEVNSDGTPSEEIVPMEAIAEAIAENKQKWIEKYNVLNVRPGRKEKNEISSGKNCIQFVVTEKAVYLEEHEIDQFIAYTYRGKSYQIPTDVVGTPNNQTIKDPFKALSLKEQRAVIQDYINTRKQELTSVFPEIQTISVRKKEKDKLELDYYSLSIGIELKDKNKTIGIIDEKITHQFNGQDHVFETDIRTVGLNTFHSYQFRSQPHTGAGKTPKRLGYSCSRSDSGSGSGTIGLKVKKNNKFYALSCFHVLCEPEYEQGAIIFEGNGETVNAPGVLDDASYDYQWPLIEGEFDSLVDAAIVEVQDAELINEFAQYPGIKLNQSRVITEENVESGQKLITVGRTSGHQTGKVKDIGAFASFDGVGRDDLILCSRISSGGDSGAAVVDDSFNVIGIIVGGNALESAVIPIETILKRLKIELA